MITAIFVKDSATLTFATSENLFLEEMAQPSRRTPLNAGQNTVVKVGSGVYRVQSKIAVAVSADAPIGIATANDKDGGPIDPPKLVQLLNPMGSVISGLETASIHRFMFSALGMLPT